ncbi:MAG: ABC transporter ATP-binding protein [Bacteroidetes bacterium]|nr:MAG: ABC transporter ATP-binding protein [Bacteroidota bacterium]
MNEELLRAIVKLFAIVAKERITDDERSNVRDFLAIHLSHDSVPIYMAIFDRHIETANAEAVDIDHDDDETIEYVDDWANIMQLCKLINEGLTKQQKLVLLLKLFELMLQDGLLSERQSNLIYYIGEVIKVTQTEINLITQFLAAQDAEDIDKDSYLLVDEGSVPHEFKSKHIIRPKITGSIFVLRIPYADTYFVKYLGISALTLNGLNLRSRKTYVFPTGSTIRGSKMKPVFYSEVVSKFLFSGEDTQLSFVAKNISHQFSTGYKALNNINISEEGGKLVGLMGASGSGKSTLLSVLNGSTQPTEGTITINGLDIYEKKDWLQGIIGFVPQDDFLIEELTVYENLFYAAQLTFGQHTKEQSDDLVLRTLKSLGLFETKDLRVGSVLDKTISGGQRKRLNIGLELLRKPTILFVDEPTSGLSSRDSVNIMDLLKELALNGKMVFVVIHQPSSDIFKMFDTMIILDVGGFPVYYGNPEQALVYFKRLVNMVNKDEGACIECGNVNSEQIFNILEAKVVDEYGRLTDRRKVPAKKWHEYFIKNIDIPKINERSDKLRSVQQIPAKLKQIAIFAMRDVQSKLKNQQYMLITFLEAPILAFFLAYLVKYYTISEDLERVYVFSKNVNIPVYFFMAIIVALFMGLTLSAEELIKDRKILKRESFLNLSRMSYLVSKMAILLMISAVQTICFVLLANWILEIHNMYFTTWLVLFSVSVFANILGLIISSAFNSAVTVYILIPVLIIPQLILSGVIINFDQFNYRVSSDKHIPMMGDIMASRWGYEALAVDQFVNNDYEKHFYAFDREYQLNTFQRQFYVPELDNQLAYVRNNIHNDSNKLVITSVDRSLLILRNEVEKIGMADRFPERVRLTRTYFDSATHDAGKEFFSALRVVYRNRANTAWTKKRVLLDEWGARPNGNEEMSALRAAHTNERMTEFVENSMSKIRIQVLDDGLSRIILPIYSKPNNTSWINLQSKFYAPEKAIFGQVISTYWVNVTVIWFMTIFAAFLLYFDVLKKVVDSIGNFREYRMYKRKGKEEVKD